MEESAPTQVAKPTETAQIFSVARASSQRTEGMDVKEKKRQLYLKDRELTQLQQEAVQRQQTLNAEIEAAHEELARRESLLETFKKAHGKPEDKKKSDTVDVSADGLVDDEDSVSKLTSSGLRMAKNSIIYQQEVHRLTVSCSEQQAKIDEIVKHGHSELRRRDAEITRRAADLKDRQADLVASLLGIDDERQRELVELLDKTKGWEQAVARDVERMQQQLRDAQKQAKIWKAKFQLRTDELTAAQQIAEVHAAELASALDMEREKNERLTAEYKVALARGVDSLKAEASRVVAQTRRDVIMEYEEKIADMRKEFDQVLLEHKSMSTGDRHTFEKKLREQQELMDQRLEDLRSDLTNYHNEVVTQLRADAYAKQSELEIKLEEERATSQRQRDQAQAMADHLMQERVLYYENRLEDQKKMFEGMLEEQRKLFDKERADKESAIAITERVRKEFDEYKLQIYEEDKKNRASHVEVVSRIRELESYEFHRARVNSTKILLEARPNFGFESELMRGVVKVKSIVQNGPADALGLKQGDTIVQANGLPVKTKSDFAKVIKATRLGTVLKLVYTRPGAANIDLSLPVATRHLSIAEITRLQRIASGIVSPTPVKTMASQNTAEEDVDFVERIYRRIHGCALEMPPIEDSPSVQEPQLLGSLPADFNESNSLSYGSMHDRRPDLTAEHESRWAKFEADASQAKAKKQRDVYELESSSNPSFQSMVSPAPSQSQAPVDIPLDVDIVVDDDVPPAPELPPVPDTDSEDEQGYVRSSTLEPKHNQAEPEDSDDEKFLPLPSDASAEEMSEHVLIQEVPPQKSEDYAGNNVLQDIQLISNEQEVSAKKESGFDVGQVQAEKISGQTSQNQEMRYRELSNNEDPEDLDIVPTVFSNNEDFGMFDGDDDALPPPPPGVEFY